ncbi:MAG: hypothetical protein EAX81_07120 [Candidatus Thorarchaeota archaeon]|nr:hypothetical protein [Candidatus Thorarchaeota archaeon]
MPTIPTFKEEKEKWAKKVVSIVVADTSSGVLDMLDIDQQRVKNLKKAVIQGEPDVEVELVNDDLLEMLSITGSKDSMVDRFEKIAGSGLTEIILGPLVTGKCRETKEEMLQEIRSRTAQSK